MANLDPAKLPTTVSLTSKACPSCKQTESFEVPAAHAKSYLEGVDSIQDALPTLTNDQRECLMSGYCPACWNSLMNEIDVEIEGDDEVG